MQKKVYRCELILESYGISIKQFDGKLCTWWKILRIFLSILVKILYRFRRQITNHFPRCCRFSSFLPNMQMLQMTVGTRPIVGSSPQPPPLTVTPPQHLPLAIQWNIPSLGKTFRNFSEFSGRISSTDGLISRHVLPISRTSHTESSGIACHIPPDCPDCLVTPSTS